MTAVLAHSSPLVAGPPTPTVPAGFVPHEARRIRRAVRGDRGAQENLVLVVVLRDVEGRSTGEIAKELGESMRG